MFYNDSAYKIEDRFEYTNHYKRAYVLLKNDIGLARRHRLLFS